MVVPDNSIGRDVPEVEERYTIYRDGTVLRHIKYFPKLDALFRNWHELTELIAVAGTQSNPEDHLRFPAFYQFCHWPVGLEPYLEPCKTHGT
ncbi:hypothetical protein JXA70_11270 [candidate division KSB1 bacterium]|nr:hypothetical protein [candidate division KSB1 bacterium]